MRSAHSLTPLLSRAMFFVLVSLLLIGQAQAVVQVVASDTVRASNDTDLSALGSWVVVSTIIPIENITGTVRFYGYDYVSNDGYVSYYNIFKNDIAIGTQRTDNGGTAWDTAPAENISIMMNTTDILSIKILKTSGIAGHVRNFRLMYDLDPQIVPIPELINGTVVLTNTSNITQNSVYLKKVKTITLSSSFNASNYQVPLTISSLGLPATTINYNDTRFVWLNSTSGSYEILPHYNDSGIYFWVNLSVVTGYNTIFMFYNNSNFTYDNFVGSQRTFPLYDDFNNGTTLNTSIWTAFKSGSANAIVDVSSGYINLSGEQNVISSGSIRSVKNFTNNVSIEFSRKYIVSGGVQSNYRSFSFGAGATPVGMDSGTADSWWQTGLNQGYHGFVQNEADAGFYYMPASGGGTIMGTDFAPGTGTSYETHKFTYLNNGSLNWYMNGVLKQTVTNTTWNNTAKGILIAQGEYSNGNGGYTNIDWAFVRNWNGSDVSTQSIGTEYSTSPGIPNITQGCNSYHGCGVNTSIAQVGSLDNIDFNITYTGLATSVDWYKNNILIQSSLSTTLSTILHLSPAVNNISVIVKNGYQNSVVFYWLFNTTEYSYSGNTPKNLSRLQRPSKTQMQYIYGNSTGFFNMSSSWIVNSTDKSISGSSIKTNPMSLWVRPIDGILNINTKQYSTGSTVLKVYVNSSLYGTYDLNDVISLDTTISLTLNPLNISNITITSDSDDNFLLYSINFNRSYPALYDGNNYFQIKRMYYEFGINQSPWNHEWTYRTYNQTLYQTDLNDINNLSFNSIGVPLIWGEIVDNINATSGISNNIYNASSLQILDWMIDNASINNKYIFLQFVTWAGWSGNQERPLGVYRTLSGYPCSTCLVNSSEASSISEMFIYLSNRYKNHTNVIFELPDEGLVEGDYTDSGWYANSQNVASWQAYSGYGDANLPHNSGYSDAKFKSLWQWEQQKFFELNNAIIPTIHLNNQLFTNYYWTKTPSPVAYQEYVSRLNNNISDADFVGIVEYPDISSSIIQLDNYYYNVSLNFIPFGSISYMAGIGINTNYTYTANRSNIVNQVFSKIITNISVVDYANQSVGYNLAGYSYWFYRETSMCPSFQVGNTCWGIKYKNDTNVSWRNDIQTLNLKFVLGLDYNSPSSITNPQTTTGNFFINNTWTDPADADFDYVYFVWSNGTSMNRNQTKGNQSLNLTYSPHYTQNISAQTVDTSGNINNTKVWFNATIPNNPITISGVNASYSLTEGQYLLIDANYSDLDSDTGTFSDNATEWDVNTSTGIVNWTAVIGNYNWQINVSDGYGSVSTQNFTVTVSSGNYMPPTPINLANTSGNYWVNYSWEAGSGNITNSYNVSVNGTWTNNSIPYRNTTVAPHGWSNITVYAYNSSGTGTLNQTPASMNTQVPNNVPTISFIVPTPANNSVNTTGSVQINTSVSDADSDNMTALLNWNNSFVGWWRMNEAAGGTLVQDFSGRGNNGTWNGNTTANVTTGQFGNALAFDGVNDYVDIPNNVISTGSDMTIEAWFITKNNTIEQNILSNNNGGIGRFDFKATSINNGNAYLLIFIGNTSNFLFFGTHIISNNVWNHAVAVRSNSYWFLYLNGSLDNSSVLTLNTIDISKDLQIGGNPSLAGYFNGSIDEVRIYNRALSASEINASYNAGSYRLNETFLGLSDRTYNYTAFIQDAHGTIGQTEIRYVTVNAQPPASITGLTNTTGNFWHNWTWTNPVDADFNYTSVYINGSFVINTSNKYYNLTANAHNQSTISTHTVDIVGNVNQTWVNHTSIIPNNLPVMNTIGNQQVTAGQWLNFTVSATDVDSDTITYGTNASNGNINTLLASDNIRYSNNTEYWMTSSAEMKPTSNLSGLSSGYGSFRITYRDYTLSGNTFTQIYKNNISYGTLHYHPSADDDTVDYTEDFYGQINASDIISVYANNSMVSYGSISLFRLKYDNISSFNWSTTSGDVGTYYWNFNSSDAYGGVDDENITVTVNAGNYIPPIPTILTATQGNFWINTTWQAGTPGNITNSYNSTNGSIWQNTSATSRNTTVSPHGWQNLTIYAYNSSGTGTLNATPIMNNTQLINNIPILTSIGSKSVNESNLLSFTLLGSDADSDTLTNSTNRTEGNSALTGNSFTWTPSYSESGVYTFRFYMNDSYGGSDYEDVQITVNDIPLTYMPPAPVNCISTNGTSHINASCSKGSGNVTDELRFYNASSGWHNTTDLFWNNTGLGEGTQRTYQIYSWNNTGILNNSFATVVNTTAITPPTPDTNTTPSLSSVTNQTCGAHYCNITFTVNQSNAITKVKYGTTTAMTSGTTNQTSGTSRSDNLTSLSNNTLYYYSVWAWNSTNTSLYTNSTMQSFTTAEDYVAPWIPAITSNLNNITGTSATSFSVNINNMVLFSAGANQTITTWTWTGATKAGGDGTTNSTATKLFDTLGNQSVSVYGTNSNGSTSTLTWTVTVVTGGGDGGTNWDYLTGTVNVAGATITTNPDRGSTTGGAYSYGYVFVDGQTYWVNVSKTGYYSNNTQITFNEDHEVWNVNLIVLPTSETTWWNSKTGDSLIVHVNETESVEFGLGLATITTAVWTLDNTTQSETSANFTTTLNSLGVHSLSAYGNIPTGVTQTVTWKLLSTRLRSGSGDEVDKLNETWFTDLTDSINGSSPDFTQFFTASVAPYSSQMGGLLYVFIYLLPLVTIWLRQEKVLIPAGLLGIFGLVLIPMLPAEWRLLAGLCVILTSFGVIYSLFKERG